jgi:hypothetical protein
VDRHRLAPQRAAPESDCPWQSCTERTRCHISLAVSHQRRRHSLIPLHCLQLNQYQRQLPRLSLHVPPLIRAQHLPERRVRCQRQRYQPQRHSPLGPGIGTLSPAERKFGSTVVSLERLVRLVRAGHCRKRWSGWTVIGAFPKRETKSAHQRENERFFEHHLTPDLCPDDIAIRFRMNRGEIRNIKNLID